MTGRARAALATPGDTDVWLVDLAAIGTRLVALARDRHLLTDVETARADGIADPARRHDWIATHAALHLVLSDHLGRPVAFDRSGIGGKPRIAGGGCDFSLSHSGSLALVAVRAQGAVGVDVETRRPIRLGAARRALVEAAGAAAHANAPLPADAELRFLTAWTRLEAIGKMRGTGIGALLETLGIVAHGPGAAAVAERMRQLVADPAQPVGLADIDLQNAEAVASLATTPPAGPPRLRDLAADLARLSP